MGSDGGAALLLSNAHYSCKVEFTAPTQYASFTLKEVVENIAPFCYGYLTQYWFGLLGPMPNQPTLQTANNHLRVAFSTEIDKSIRVVILENGVVRFDFENYQDGGVFIYRYEKLSNGVSNPLHTADLESREIEVQQFAFRLIQVHAVLLDNARRMLERCSSYTARPNESTEMLRGYDIADPIGRLEPNFKSWIPLPHAVAQKIVG